MEAAVAEKNTRTRHSDYFREISIPKQKEEILTYEILQQHKREQQRLIAAGLMEKPKIVYGFTPEECAAFDRRHSVEEVFDNIAKKYGF